MKFPTKNQLHLGVVGSARAASASRWAWTLAFLFFALLNAGCSTGYVLRNAWAQVDLLWSREPLEKVLESPRLTEADKAKLRLARDAKQFAELRLGLNRNLNYESFVQLDRDSVSYVINAAPIDRLEHHTWWYPVVGSLPYRGYFNREVTEREAKALAASGELDVHWRGVAAYSTLGWFNDPILSSMLRYDDYTLVNTIIHENVHATVFIKSNADFNERLATFLGNWAADLFFAERDGPDSAAVKAARAERSAEQIFSKFISKELDSLRDWFAGPAVELKKDRAAFLKARRDRYAEIQARFQAEIEPALRAAHTPTADHYARALDPERLNNARLLLWRTYVYDLSDFEKALTHWQGDARKLIEWAKALKSDSDPEAELKALIKSHTPASH
ncbi:MAG TPA: aminopeptidase [Pseudobdellovibrionaceae bacterium]|mgnify:CR=1 FL=1|nr:aminopeptidase [Pseudobdellovibrionaceae bacterium]